jgi:hypothetical protein
MNRLTTELTPKQARLLDFITPWVQEQDYAPTLFTTFRRRISATTPAAEATGGMNGDAQAN